MEVKLWVFVTDILLMSPWSPAGAAGGSDHCGGWADLREGSDGELAGRSRGGHAPKIAGDRRAPAAPAPAAQPGCAVIAARRSLTARRALQFWVCVLIVDDSRTLREYRYQLNTAMFLMQFPPICIKIDIIVAARPVRAPLRCNLMEQMPRSMLGPPCILTNSTISF